MEKRERTLNIDGFINTDDSIFLVNRLNLQKGNFCLKDISFSLPIGKTLALFGESGSGKTLLLRSIAGLENIRSGSVFFGNKRIDGIEVQERNIAFVFQNYALFPHLNVKGNIGFPLSVTRKEKKTADSKISKVIRDLNIDEVYQDFYPSELSEGIKQLVAIGKEKIKKFDLLLMDEPMSQLDKQEHAQMRFFIKKILKDLNSTIIICLNDPEDALVICDFIAVMIDGKIVQYGETKDVYNNPVSLQIMELTSRFEVNKMKVEVINGKVTSYGIPVNQADGNYQMAFRAEEVEIKDSGIQASINNVHFFDGKRQLAQCQLEDETKAVLLIPGENKGRITFIPKNPLFFPVKE